MENSDLIKIILTSTLIASIISSIVSALISIKLKTLDYKNEYYKRILTKRLNAYQFLERQISVLKSTVLGDDGKPYHLIFSYGEDKFQEFQENLFLAMAYSIWINNVTVEKMEKLNEIFFMISRKYQIVDGTDLIEVGKKYYNQIANLRNDIEISVRNDLINLHNFSKLKKKVHDNLRGLFLNIFNKRS